MFYSNSLASDSNQLVEFWWYFALCCLRLTRALKIKDYELIANYTASKNCVYFDDKWAFAQCLMIWSGPIPILVISKRRTRDEFWPYAVSVHSLFWNIMMKKSHQQKIAHCVWKSSSKIGWLMLLKTSFGVVSYAFSNYLCTWKSFRRCCMEWQCLP